MAIYLKLANEIAVINGSTSGIGAAIAARLAGQGARVIISGRNAEWGQTVVEQLKATGANASFAGCDVGNAASVEEPAARTLEIYGQPTILVNAAGILQSGKRVLDQDEAEHRALWVSDEERSDRRQQRDNDPGRRLPHSEHEESR